MEKRNWTVGKDVTETLQKSREKRKWQIALRRYVIEKNSCVQYAPYFGLDILSLRKWFEGQFEGSIGWQDFGAKWQFEHLIPLTYFDFSNEADLHLCWNFLNLKVGHLKKNSNKSFWLNITLVKKYFQDIYNCTAYSPCLELINKIEAMQTIENIDFSKQQHFIEANRAHLEKTKSFTAFEFELLNSGRTIEEISKEIEFF